MRRLPSQLRPDLDSPPLDRRFIPLDRTGDRDLRCPVQVLQQAGNMVFVERYPQFPLDNFGDASTRPDFAAEPVSFRTMPKKIGNQALLLAAQLWMTKMRTRPQSCRPF